MENKEIIKEHIFRELDKHLDPEEGFNSYYLITNKDRNPNKSLDITTTPEEGNPITREELEEKLNRLDYTKKLVLYTCRDNYMISLDYADRIDGYYPDFSDEIIKDLFYIDYD